MSRDRGSSLGSGPTFNGQDMTREIALLQAAQMQQEVEQRELRQQVTTGFSNVFTELKGLGAQIAAKERANYPMVFTLFGGSFAIITTMVTGAYFITSQQTQVLVQPLQLEARAISQSLESTNQELDSIEDRVRVNESAVRTSVEKDAQSEADRRHLNAEVEATKLQAASNSAYVRELRAWAERDSGEKETQIDASEQTRNMQVDEIHRMLSVLWTKLGLGVYPAWGAVQPRIANRIDQPLNGIAP